MLPRVASLVVLVALLALAGGCARPAARPAVAKPVAEPEVWQEVIRPAIEMKLAEVPKEVTEAVLKKTDMQEITKVEYSTNVSVPAAGFVGYVVTGNTALNEEVIANVYYKKGQPPYIGKATLGRFYFGDADEIQKTLEGWGVTLSPPEKQLVPLRAAVSRKLENVQWNLVAIKKVVRVGEMELDRKHSKPGAGIYFYDATAACNARRGRDEPRDEVFRFTVSVKGGELFLPELNSMTERAREDQLILWGQSPPK